MWSCQYGAMNTKCSMRSQCTKEWKTARMGMLEAWVLGRNLQSTFLLIFRKVFDGVWLSAPFPHVSSCMSFALNTAGHHPRHNFFIQIK